MIPGIPGIRRLKILMQIVRSDMEIRKKLREWIDEATSYQKLALARMNEIHLELNNS